MSKLLHARFYHMSKELTYKLCLLFMFVSGLLISLKAQTQLDKIVFSFTLFIGLVTAVYCGMSLGTEYSDGTLRNKLIIGYTRSHIYMTHLLINMIASLSMCIVFELPILSIGLMRLGAIQLSSKMIITLFAISLLISCAYSSLFTLIGLLSRNKAQAAVLCLLSFILLIGFAGYNNTKLSEPEFIDTYAMTISGETSLETEPNPNYIDGLTREIYETLYDINPAGQSLQFFEMKLVHIERLPLYSLMIIMFTSMIGISIFKRINIK